MKETEQCEPAVSLTRHIFDTSCPHGVLATLKMKMRRAVAGNAKPVTLPSILHAQQTSYREVACCIFSHHAFESAVDQTVYRYLAAIRDAGYAIIFVSAAPCLPDEDVSKLRAVCSSVLHRANSGMDFASWKSALELYPDIRLAPELLLANDSVYVHPTGLPYIFSVMNAVDCDFWGLTESREKLPHLQSYFLVLRTRALRHAAFAAFWDTVGILSDKRDIIERYEIGMTRALLRAGLKAAAYVPALCAQNPTLARPVELLSRCCLPMIKRACLHDNPLRVPLHHWDSYFTPDEADDIRKHANSRGVPLPHTKVPEVSILLPTYNGAVFLPQLLDSLSAGAQTRLLVRDDSSTDATLTLLHQHKEHFGEAMEIHAGARLGVVGNTQWLLGRCKTPYFLLADQDDVWESDKLPALWEAMQRLESLHGKDVPLLVYSDASLIDKDDRLLAPSFFAAMGTPLLWGEDFRNTLVFSSAPGCTMMGNRALAQAALPMPDGIFMHDWWLLLVAGALGGVRVVNAPLVRYRQHAHNVMGASVWNFRALLAKGLSGPKSSRIFIRTTQMQAQSLLARHGAAMTSQHRQVCAAWASMPHMWWPQRLATLVRYSFSKPGKVRNALFYMCN